jgi:NitT/TauT family transport system substrate-binding protein
MRILLICRTAASHSGATVLVLLLALLLAACRAPQAPAAAATAPEPADEPLRLAGPGAVVSFPLMRMAEVGVTVDGRMLPAKFRLWQSADQLRVMLARGEIDYSATPANLPALMANRGEPVRLLNVSVWGLLWLVSRDPQVHDFGDLRGRTLLTPFRRDMGAIALHELYAAQGLEPGRDLQLHQARDALDAVALMLAGQADHAVLPEPTASLLLQRNRNEGGAPLYRVQSLEAAWALRFPQQPELPQAGVMAAAPRAADTALAQAIVTAYAEASRWCKDDPPACAALARRHLPHMPLPALEESIRVTRLDGLPTAQVRPQLEALYRLILASQPEAVGGRLPDPAFYGP